MSFNGHEKNRNIPRQSYLRLRAVVAVKHGPAGPNPSKQPGQPQSEDCPAPLRELAHRPRHDLHASKQILNLARNGPMPYYSEWTQYSRFTLLNSTIQALSNKLLLNSQIFPWSQGTWAEPGVSFFITSLTSVHRMCVHYHQVCLNPSNFLRNAHNRFLF